MQFECAVCWGKTVSRFSCSHLADPLRGTVKALGLSPLPLLIRPTRTRDLAGEWTLRRLDCLGAITLLALGRRNSRKRPHWPGLFMMCTVTDRAAHTPVNGALSSTSVPTGEIPANRRFAISVRTFTF